MKCDYCGRAYEPRYEQRTCAGCGAVIVTLPPYFPHGMSTAGCTAIVASTYRAQPVRATRLLDESRRLGLKEPMTETGLIGG